MEETNQETSVALTKKSIKPSIAKIEALLHAKKDYHPYQQQITPSSFIIQSKKTQKKRKSLPIALLLAANYSCGGSLKSLSVKQKNDYPYQVIRTNRFPNSIFQINQVTEKSRSFILISNFLGTKYNLYENQQNVMTICFAAGCCSHSYSRQFAVYMLASGTIYSQLKKNTNQQDLQELYVLPENQGTIKRYNTLQPKRNLESGNLHLNFTRKHVLPAVQNAIVVNSMDEQMMQIVKLGVNAFEVSLKEDIPIHLGVAVGIASLDFKWALQ